MASRSRRFDSSLVAVCLPALVALLVTPYPLWVGLLLPALPDPGMLTLSASPRRSLTLRPSGVNTAVAKDPTTVANKWSANLSNASQSIRDGVNQVTTAPGQAAAAAQATMRAQILAAIDSGKWAANVSAVSLASWKNQMLTKGLTNIANGARNGIPKMQAFLQTFLPYVAQVQQTIKSMPNVTQADRENRMIQNMRLMSQFKKQPGT